MSGRADTPTPEFVGNSRVRGARSPPGTPRDLTTPSRAHLGPAAGHTDLPADFARAKRRSVPPPDFFTAKRRSAAARTSQTKVGKSCARVDFSRAKRRSVPPAGLSQSKVGKCARRRFRAAGRCARPAAKNRPPGEKKPGFFPAPTRMYKEARPPFSQKKPLTFRPGRVMDVRAGRETAQKAQPGRAGEAAAGERRPP